MAISGVPHFDHICSEEVDSIYMIVFQDLLNAGGLPKINISNWSVTFYGLLLYRIASYLDCALYSGVYGPSFPALATCLLCDLDQIIFFFVDNFLS